MRAARVHRWGTPPVVDDVPAPVAGEGETLVRVSAAAVGHLDLSVASGTFGLKPPLPYVPGTDGAGRVASTGAPVRVRGGGLGTTRDGTWAELVAVPDSALSPLPEDVDAGLAACFFSPATTASVALHEVGGFRAGQRVAVTGAAGAVGSLVVQLATRAGAAEVVGLVGRPEKAGQVPAGATVVVGRGDDALVALDGVDLLVDTVGGQGLVDLLARVAPGGRAALVGYTAGTAVTLDLPSLMLRDVALLPVNLLRRGPQLSALGDELLGMLAAGELSLAVTRYPLDQVDRAVADLAAGRASGRVVVEP